MVHVRTNNVIKKIVIHILFEKGSKFSKFKNSWNIFLKFMKIKVYDIIETATLHLQSNFEILRWCLLFKLGGIFALWDSHAEYIYDIQSNKPNVFPGIV